MARSLSSWETCVEKRKKDGFWSRIGGNSLARKGVYIIIYTYIVVYRRSPIEGYSRMGYPPAPPPGGNTGLGEGAP